MVTAGDMDECVGGVATEMCGAGAKPGEGRNHGTGGGGEGGGRKPPETMTFGSF